MIAPPADHGLADRQADALIDEIARKVEETCAAIRAEATRDAEAVRLRAREKARRQLQRAVAEMRASTERRSAQVRAEQETARGRRSAGQAMQVLTQAWPMLGEAIAQRWSNPGARAPWMAAQIAQAGARLGGRPWRVRHPAAWVETEVDALRAALAGSGVAAATLQPDAALSIGLVIEADGVRLDSTPAALLADRAGVQARLLAAIATGRPGSAGS